MFEGMGIQWASTLLGCVAAALVPIPVIFYLYGHKLRAKSSFAPTPPPMMHQLDEEEGVEGMGPSGTGSPDSGSATQVKGE